MPLIHQYTLVCDEVRLENNGKLIVIGLYTPDIFVPQFPFAFPSLTFLQAFMSDQAGQFQFRARIQHLESGQGLAQAMGTINVRQPGFAASVLRFGNLTVTRDGVYNLIVNVDPQPDPITVSFNIGLQARTQIQ